MKHRRQKKRLSLGLPRRTIPVVWAVVVVVIQILLPWAVSQLGPHLGWVDGRPGVWHLMGLIGVGLGISLYTWCLAVHFKDYPSSVRLGFSPPQLVVAGPYRFTRNPMYQAGLLTWLGWMFFFGSPAVLVALVLLGALIAFYVVPLEERQLEAMFGEEYVVYRRSVPRWLGKVSH